MPVLQITDIHKRFGHCEANRGASLDVQEGEIHALVGENGAGKSTLMRILAGMHRPDTGRIEVDGRDITGWSTADAIAAGVGMVHQHFMLVPTLTVAENIVLGREPRRGPALDMALAVRQVEKVAAEYGLQIDPRRRVADLSVGEAQRVEILKALFRGARILILDEPTAVLSPPEVKDLWRVLRGLKANGGTIVLITHKLDEVMAVSDRVTVMRQGRTVAQMNTADSTPADVACAMVGRNVALPGEASYVAAASTREGAALELRGVAVAGSGGRRGVDGVTITIAPGEIVGIAGVEGNGQTELIDAIVGLRPVTSGRLVLGSRDITRMSVRLRADAGLAHIPEDRHQRGLILEYSVADNLILGQQHRFSRGWRLDRSRVTANAEEKMREFDIRPGDSTLPVSALSGGNQQKVVIARAMGSTFSCLLAAQPTRGVDVGAIEFIHARLRAARDAGKGVLLVSAELSEILALSDRVAVMYGGRIVAVLPRAEASEASLGPLMTGASPGGASAA
jgi:general nucleoside transport system ATP-binding protein